MKLECTKKQLEIIQRALEIYGRIRMLQFDHIMDDFVWNPLTDSKEGDLPSREVSEWELFGCSIVKNAFKADGRRDKDGDIAFSMHKQIHRLTLDKPHKNCCTCDRSDMLAGQPAIRIEKE